MKTKRTIRILGVALLAAAVLLACGSSGKIFGTVTCSFSGRPLYMWAGASTSLVAEPNYGCMEDDLGEQARSEGKYSYSNLNPGNYTLYASAYGYQSQTRQLAITGDSEQNFSLDPVPANIVANVVALDAVGPTGKTGGYRQVKVDITFQDFCHYPRRLVVWAFSAETGPFIVFDNDGYPMNYEYYMDSSAACNPERSPYPSHDITYHLAFGWDTRSLPNGPYTLKAFLQATDPHGDGTDIDPDPEAVLWVHEAGTPPAGTQDGSPGGSTLSVQVVNVVINEYNSNPGNIHYFKYDPEGTGYIAAPEVYVSVDNWRNEPMTIYVFMAPTSWQIANADFLTWIDSMPFMALEVDGPGDYTLAWDGSNPGVCGPGESEWGTYTYDIAVFLDGDGDHFVAKTNSGRFDYNGYATYFGEHGVDWEFDETNDDIHLVCWYNLDGSPEPASVALVAMDPELEEKATLPLTGNDDLTLGQRHPAEPSPGHRVYTTDYSEAVDYWRVVLTGQTNSGANIRRDRQNPPMLATNAPAIRRTPIVIYSHSDRNAPPQSNRHVDIDMADKIQQSLESFSSSRYVFLEDSAGEINYHRVLGLNYYCGRPSDPNGVTKVKTVVTTRKNCYIIVNEDNFDSADTWEYGWTNSSTGIDGKTIPKAYVCVVHHGNLSTMLGIPPGGQGFKNAYSRVILHEIGHALGIDSCEHDTCSCYNKYCHYIPSATCLCVMATIERADKKPPYFFASEAWNGVWEFTPLGASLEAREIHRKTHRKQIRNLR